MKMIKKFQFSILICVSACLAAACSFMSPQPDRTQYFVLSPAAQSDSSASSASTSQLTIGVGPIRFPGYLKRPGVVTRTTSNQLTVSDENRWAEPLDENFEGTLCQNLARMLGTTKIRVYPWYADTHIDYQVEVWVDHFEATDDGRSQLSAVWTIRDGRDGKMLASSQSVQSAPVQSGDGSAALSQDLAAMSREIADRIAALAQSRPSA
jgi:uncharacterized protein